MRPKRSLTTSLLRSQLLILVCFAAHSGWFCYCCFHNFICLATVCAVWLWVSYLTSYIQICCWASTLSFLISVWIFQRLNFHLVLLVYLFLFLQFQSLFWKILYMTIYKNKEKLLIIDNPDTISYYFLKDEVLFIRYNCYHQLTESLSSNFPLILNMALFEQVQSTLYCTSTEVLRLWTYS